MSEPLPSVEDALNSLMPNEHARLLYLFEQGEAGLSKVRGHKELFIAVHAGQLPQADVVCTEGKWSLCRKKVVDE